MRSNTQEEEEALLYNMKIEEVLSHGKKIIRWEIANEEVNLGSDGKSYTRDMIWRIYHIGNEAYVALSRPQLERLGLRFIPSPKATLIMTRDFV
ncbi:MAG: hypothetical protein IPH16_17160 [Haliscomenobacter sp.]|nr:hypothetical protein [Haliscomenobacter sp.]